MEAAVAVENAERVVVLELRNTLHLCAVGARDFHGAEAVGNALIGFEDGFLELVCTAEGGDVGEVGSERTALAADRVALGATPATPEDVASRLDVARDRLEAGHVGAGDAGADGVT